MVDTTFIVIGSVNYMLPPNPHGSNITTSGGIYFGGPIESYINSAYPEGKRGYIEGTTYHNFSKEKLHVVCIEFPSMQIAAVSNSDENGYYRFDNLHVDMQYMIMAHSISNPDKSTTSALKSPLPYLAT